MREYENEIGFPKIHFLKACEDMLVKVFNFLLTLRQAVYWFITHDLEKMSQEKQTIHVKFLKKI